MGNKDSLQKEKKALKSEIDFLHSDENIILRAQKEQEDYQDSQIRFRTIFETSRLGNKIIGPDLKILQLNSAMVALLGYETKEEVIGTFILDYVPPEFHCQWKILQTKLWNQNTPSFNLEACLRKKDGSIIWCNVTSILFQDQGNTLGYSIIEDISEQPRFKKHKQDFINIASHELKTPLTSLNAALQLMTRIIKKEKGISDQLIGLSEKAESYMLKLNKLVNDLLDFSRVEKGQLALNTSRFSLPDLFDKCCDHIRLEGKYFITYKGNQTLELIADEQRINQVIVNLVNNAVKYAPESLEITILVEEFKDSIKVSITDKGKGIPPDKLPHIFEAYYQVDNDGKHGSGLGLGLYISAEIIKKHGGTIGAVSRIEEGSTFWFTIPKTHK